jgi:membrane protein implicated in regulation of membrane protease activity
MEWWIWAIAAVALGVGELLTTAFILGPIAATALITALVAALGGPSWLQLIVFIAGSIGSIALVRPVAKRHLQLPPPTRTGTDALIGTKALVLQRVDLNGGRVRIGGEEWSARAYMEDQVLEPGARVEVVKIEGATALVYE